MVVFQGLAIRMAIQKQNYRNYLFGQQHLPNGTEGGVVWQSAKILLITNDSAEKHIRN